MNTNAGQASSVILDLRNVKRTVVVESEPKIIINSFSYSFEQGHIYTIVGPSGSGKSSLLRLCNRLDEKDGGSILFHHKPIESYPVTELRKKIALVFQVPYLFPGTVESNLLYGVRNDSLKRKSSLEDILHQVGLGAEFLHRSPEGLSVGQQQRVALARSLALEPDIVLLDEPTSALDLSSAITIEKLIQRLNRELGLTIIMVTHNFEQAVRLNGISLVLVEGRLIEASDTNRLFNNPQSELTRKFIAGELR